MAQAMPDCASACSFIPCLQRTVRRGGGDHRRSFLRTPLMADNDIPHEMQFRDSSGKSWTVPIPERV